MAAQRTPKAELIAIYRLEFYKKQKNWKLSVDVKKEKEAQKYPTNAKVLNETYSIESDVNYEQYALNDAFLVDEPASNDINSDKEAPTTTVTLRAQLLEPISACEQCQRNSLPQTPWADCVDSMLPAQKDIWDYGNVDKCSGDGDTEFEGFDGGYIGGMVWTNSGYPQNWIGDTVPQVDMAQETVCPAPLQWAPEREEPAPWPHDQLWLPDIWGEEELLMQSLEDMEDFMIGAHSAPHSSEIELCVTDSVFDKGDVESNVNMWSSQRGEWAGRRAAGYRSTLTLDTCAPNYFELTPGDFVSTDCSYDPFPTRDSAPLPPHGGYAPRLHTRLDAMSYCDGFVAGSFRTILNSDCVGRGRGRLPDDSVGYIARPGAI